MIYTRRITGIETEYGIAGKLSPEDTARYLFRPIVAEYFSTNIFHPNASRLYLDVGSHPEIATAECDGLRQLIAHERAGDRILNELADTAEQALAEERVGGHVHLIKNNVDDAGNSYGCHENYLIGREMVLKTLGKQLLAFMITRQLICGAGLVGEEGFLLSQRADQVFEGISSATTRSRPIINTRDEPHGDSSRFRRMHVIVGDSNMAEPTLALTVGSSGLVLELLAAGVDLPDLELADPIGDIRRIARDITGATPVSLKNGGTITALEIQEIFHEAAVAWLPERPAEPDPELERVVELWGRTLEAVRGQDYSTINREIDWAIKLDLLNRYRGRLGGDWSHPKLAQLDLSYHNIRPAHGIYPMLEARGLVERWITDEEIREATTTAPQTTRAALRGRFLTRARETGAKITVDWVHLKLNGEGGGMVELSDPFSPVDERVDALLEKMG